jgi:hypothetical protein
MTKTKKLIIKSREMPVQWRCLFSELFEKLKWEDNLDHKFETNWATQ